METMPPAKKASKKVTTRKTNVVPAGMQPDLLKEYERQMANYEADLAQWHVKRIKLLFILIGTFDLIVGLGVALIIVGIVEAGTKEVTANPDIAAGPLLAGLIITIVFICASLVCSAFMAYWKRRITDVPKIAGCIAFIGMFGGLTIVNTVLCIIAWFKMNDMDQEQSSKKGVKAR